MKNEATLLFNILFAGILIAAFWYLLFQIRNFLTDTFRQEMFTLRDQLFIEASKGLIDFNHPAYGMLRETMNGYLRFSHQISFLSCAFVFLLPSTRKDLNNPSLSFDYRWNRKMKGLPVETKDTLKAYRKEMHKLVLGYLWLTSPLAIFLSIIFLIVAIPTSIGKSIKDRIASTLSKPVRDLDSTAMAYGKL